MSVGRASSRREESKADRMFLLRPGTSVVGSVSDDGMRKTLLLTCWLGFGAACTPTGEETEPERVLTVEDIASDRAGFDGEIVTVEGYLLWSWEGGGLFDSDVAEAGYDRTHGIALFGNRHMADETHFSGTYARVVGSFRAEKGLVWHGILAPAEIVPLRRFRDMRPLPREFVGTPEEMKARNRAVFESMTKRDPQAERARRERDEYLREYVRKRDAE